MKRGSNESCGTSTKFQRLSGREHILVRSDMYVGSICPDDVDSYVINDDLTLSKKTVKVAPGFLQVVEEAIMNAADRVSAAHEVGTKIVHKTTKIVVEVEGKTVSVENNGDGICCEFLEEFGVYAPELIFGHLRTSSNYDDNNERLNVGRNGIGIKIANIFSEWFKLETVDYVKKKKYTQVFRKNMSVKDEPGIEFYGGAPFTRVTFSLELARFGMEGDNIPVDIVSILRRRCHEVQLCSLDPVKVVFNGRTLKTNSLDKYLGMFGVENVATHISNRWKFGVAFTPEIGRFRHFSFVNSTSTPQGGTHVSYAVDGFLKNLVNVLRKKIKTPKLKASVVKDLLTVVVSAHVINPTFSGQTKDMLTLPSKDFGSTFSVPDSVLTKILKSGIVEFVSDLMKNKDESLLNETDGKKTKSIRGISKLHDAQWAGTRKSSDCLLIVTEGDSALTMALSATSVIGREKFGCFPLRGKLLNVRDAPSSQVSNNSEITSIKKILGLQNGVKYDKESVKLLRYGGIVLLTDADLDGSHIRGLLLNLFDTFWPELLSLGFVKSISTPIVRVTKGSEKILFYNDFDYNSWKESTNISGYKIKYLKGLGSSTPEEAREYFSKVYESLIRYDVDEHSRESMSLAFDKTRAADRKEWLSHYDSKSIIGSHTRSVDISTFVNSELIHFSQGDLLRSMPSVVDGLKVSQRKALCGAFMKGIENVEAKVAQLTGYISDKTQYHHGEASMSGTIVGMAQNFVGSNNIEFFSPKGQLGSRVSNGADAASPRYTFVQMNKITPFLFKKEDLPVLKWNSEEGVTTEPVFYCPIIPTLLVNGCRSIATGYSTNIYQYNPADLVMNVRKRLNGEEPELLTPYFRGFAGKIEVVEGGESFGEGGQSFACHGVYEVVGKVVRITEIPIGTSILSYKNYLDTLVDKKLISGFKESCSDIVVDFEVTLKNPVDESSVESSVVKLLKLKTVFRTTNMHAFDASGKIKKYGSVSEIEEEHFAERMGTYVCRRNHQISVLKFEQEVLAEKVRFFEAKISGNLVLENVPYNDVIQTLKESGFKELKVAYNSPSESFEYLTNLKMFDATLEKVSDLRKLLARKSDELTEVQSASVKYLWEEDLRKLESVLN